jgi:pSer/pThr/pTyr-binding forkhead associated (FHA) protein
MPLRVVVRSAVPEDVEARGPTDGEQDGSHPAPAGGDGAGALQGPELSITFDTPRLVIGRGEGADLRLPDPSVSARHASVRARGAELVLIDEGSTNGTFLDSVRLPPQSPRVLRTRERVRVGRVWLEMHVDPSAPPTPRAAAAAKELALSLVSRALAGEGEDGRPRVRVESGPDAGKELRLDASKSWVIGRARECDLCLDDTEASRRHVELSVRGEQVMVQDLGSRGGAELDGAALGSAPVVWAPGRVLGVAGNRLLLSHAAADALAELERSPDERMALSEVIEPPPEDAEPAGDAAGETPPPEALIATRQARPAPLAEPEEQRGWNLTDGAVMVAALGVLALSVAGLIWLLGK